MILEAIKDRTLKNHKWLEESELLMPLSGRNINLETYQRILRKFYGFFFPLESLVSQYTGLKKFLPDFETRRRAHLLRQDLQVVQTQAEMLPVDLPVCPDLPVLRNESQALGSLYVMEGSTLGGRFISKVLSEHLGLTAENGAAFFNGYGPATGTRWKTFQQGLVAYCTATGQDEAVIAAANDTFEKMGRWIRS